MNRGIRFSIKRILGTAFQLVVLFVLSLALILILISVLPPEGRMTDWDRFICG